MAKRTGANGALLESDLQMFRVRRDAHAAAKLAALEAGMTLEQWASDALMEKAERQRGKKKR